MGGYGIEKAFKKKTFQGIYFSIFYYEIESMLLQNSIAVNVKLHVIPIG